jgi:hypothetical protein
MGKEGRAHMTVDVDACIPYVGMRLYGSHIGFAVGFKREPIWDRCWSSQIGQDIGRHAVWAMTKSNSGCLHILLVALILESWFATRHVISRRVWGAARDHQLSR